jgi:hypothetical protein
MRKGPLAGGFAISTVLLLVFCSAVRPSPTPGAKGLTRWDRWDRCPRRDAALRIVLKAVCRARPLRRNARAAARNSATTTISRWLASSGGRAPFRRMGSRTLITASTWRRKNNPLQAHPGIVVIDVSDPTNPQAAAYLADTPAALSPHKVNEARGLLGLVQDNGPNFAVYDLN